MIKSKMQNPKLILSCFFAFLAFNCYAKEVTILYTGDTHAMIYSCNCPIEPDGGLARRATLIKELRKEDPQAVLLDSGGFFAGGLMDEYTQNTEMDRQRTLVNLKAMELMKYDAAAVGDDEFSFGRDFFEESLGNTKLNFLSCNLKSDKVSPYIIKEVSGIKLGIIGVSNLATRQKAGGIEVINPRIAVEGAVNEVKKNGASIIILLSRLGESEDLNLIKDVKGIDVVIIGKSRAKEESFSNLGNTFILRPSWQGKRLGKAVVTIQDNRVTDCKAEEIRLSDKIADDPQVLSALPQCFSEANCKKEGFIGACNNPGTLSSACSFKEADKIDLLVITGRDCIGCADQRTVDSLKKQLPGLSVSYLYYPDKKAQEIISDLGLTGLPAYLFSKEIENEINFDKSKVGLKGGYYVLKPKYGGLAYFLKREKIKGKLDLFMSLFDEKSGQTLEALKEFNPEIHFLTVEPQPGYFDASKGKLEVEEYLRSVCVKKYYPEYFWEYIDCRAKNIDSSWWDDCLTKYNTEKIRTCAKGMEGISLLRKNIELNRGLEIMFGPTYLLDNQQIFATQGVPSKEELKKIIKK